MSAGDKLRSFIWLFPITIAILLSVTSCDQVPTQTEVEEVPPEGYVRIGPDSLYYKMIGEGRPMIVIHGGPGLDHSYLRPHLDSLQNDYQLIFFDQRGSGRSYTSESSEITVDRFVDDIEELRVKLRLGRVHLLGHSWGGLLAMLYANEYKTHLRTLIVVNPMSPSSELREEENKILSSRRTSFDSTQMAEITTSNAFQNGRKEAMENLIHLGFKREFYDTTKLEMLKISISDDYQRNNQILNRLSGELEDYNHFRKLRSIYNPTLIIYGAHDPLSELAGIRIQQTIGNANYIRLRECGHFPFIEKRDDFYEMVHRFLTEYKR